MKYTQKSVTEENAWTDLWQEWKFEKELPKINFHKQVVLVDVVPGAGNNFQMATVVLTENGDLRPSVMHTEIAGPGDKGKERPVEVRVLNMSTPEYVVSIVVSRGNIEKHTHVAITYLRK